MSETPDWPAGAPVFAGTTAIAGVAALAAAFDGFILDQWGVLHDGTRPYPGALECLEHLRAAGKRIVILSNSSKRESENVRVMAKMGFGHELFDRILTAGEDAHAALQARTEGFHEILGNRCYAFTRGGDRSLLEDLGLDLVDRVENADFLVVLGSDAPERVLADYEPELQAAFARDLPMVCANPDLARLTPQGIIEAAAVLARRYEDLGGRVFYHGKPHPPIYRSCLAALGCDARKVIAVGDSVEHDILGAARVGLRNALIPGGVHAAELGIAWGELPKPETWQRFAAEAPVQPDYLLAAFNW